MIKNIEKLHITLCLTLGVFSIFNVFSQVEVPLQKRTEFTIKGDFKFVSNTILGKVSNDNDTDIFDPNKSYNGGGINNQFKMGFIDIDNDPSTFNSSSADLIIDSNCAAIKHVGLYWTAAYADATRSQDITQIKMKFPGDTSYTTITNGQVIHDYYNDPKSVFKQYACYKDITNEIIGLKDPIGTYTVANIPATITETNDDKELGNGLAGGWTMVVIYQDDTKQRKRFYVYDGYVNIDSKSKPVEFSFDNFQTIPEGSVHGKIGIISYEGDKGIIGDRLKAFSNETNSYKGVMDGVNPMNNFFNANITENGKNVKTRVPASENTLGYDADLFEIKNLRNSIIGNNQTKASFKLLTDNDGYSVMAVAFSVEIYEPDIHMTKRSRYSNSDSYVYPNDILSYQEEITYSLTVSNDGNDNAKNTVIKDIIPKNVIFSKESLVLPSKKIKVNFDKPSRELIFIIPDKMVKLSSDPFEILYTIKLNTGCELLDNVTEVTIVDEPVVAEFNGSLTEDKKYSKGNNHINKCNIPDYYQFKLAVDMSGLNCPNAIRIAALPKKSMEKDTDPTLFNIEDSNSSNNHESTGVNSDSTLLSVAELASKIKPGKTLNDLINLNDIYFEFDKWNITPKAEIELNKIIDLMNSDFPKLVIKIETHSDSRGDKNYNLELSQKRAESIYDYLISKDISENRVLSYIGFGESKPVNNCKDGEDCSEKEFQKNRRSSFVIME